MTVKGRKEKALRTFISTNVVLSDEEILEEHKKVYWSEARSHNQPYPAYKLNTEITIRLTRVDFSENLEYNK